MTTNNSNPLPLHPQNGTSAVANPNAFHPHALRLYPTPTVSPSTSCPASPPHHQVLSNMPPPHILHLKQRIRNPTPLSSEVLADASHANENTNRAFVLSTANSSQSHLIRHAVSPCDASVLLPPRNAMPLVTLNANPVTLPRKNVFDSTAMLEATPSLGYPTGQQRSLSVSSQDSQSSSSSSSSKRKSSVPCRSIDSATAHDDKLMQGVVKLDVYSMYLRNPRELLFTRCQQSFGQTRPNRVSGRSNSFSGPSSSYNSGSFGGLVPAYHVGGVFGGLIPASGCALPMARSSSHGSSKKPKSGRPPVSAQGSSSQPANGVYVTTGNEKAPEAAEEMIFRHSIDLSLFKDTFGSPTVYWRKGSPLDIPTSSPYYDDLTPEEVRVCSAMRILPEQYLHIKETILTQVETRGPFKKRDAKAWFRIDVNKTAIIFDWFRALGWIPMDEQWYSHRRSTSRQAADVNAREP